MPFLITLLVALLLRRIVVGKFGGFGSERLRGELILQVTLLLVVLLPAAARFGATAALVVPVWLGLMALLAGACLVNARANPGFVGLAVGVLLNLVVIWANGAMPVLPSAATAATGGRPYSVGADTFHSLASEGTKAVILADTLPMPGPRSWRAVLSIGDVLMLVGVVIVVVRSPVSAGANKSGPVRR